jgi:predicted component of type VI protein secretion system
VSWWPARSGSGTACRAARLGADAIGETVGEIGALLERWWREHPAPAPDVVALLAAAVLVHDGADLRDGLRWRVRYRASRGATLEGQAIRGLAPHLQDLGLPHAARLLQDYGSDHA